MRKPVIHLYTVCWNEEYMIPYFFRHYDEIVDRYVIIDDGSTDNTLEMLKKHPRVEVRHLSRPAEIESAVLAGKEIYDNCWKESRGKADWVIITDMDEHIYHKDLLNYLSECQKAGVTLIPETGFQMLSRDLPDSERKLTEIVTRGAFLAPMSKLGIFDPNRITEINYAPGRHFANPAGNVVYPPHDEVLLLHYKYLSLEWVHQRNGDLFQKLGKVDKEKGWGHKYSWEKENLQTEFEMFDTKAVDNVLLLSNEERALLPGNKKPWWRQ